MKRFLHQMLSSASFLGAGLLVGALLTQTSSAQPNAGIPPKAPPAVGKGPPRAAPPAGVPGQPNFVNPQGQGTAAFPPANNTPQPNTNGGTNAPTNTPGTGTISGSGGSQTGVNPNTGLVNPVQPVQPVQPVPPGSNTIPAQPFPGTGQSAIPAQPGNPTAQQATSDNQNRNGTPNGNTNDSGTGTNPSNGDGANNPRPGPGDRFNQNSNNNSLVRSPTSSGSANVSNSTGANASLLSTDSLIRGLTDMKVSNLNKLNGGDLVNINSSWNNVQVQALRQTLQSNSSAQANAQMLTQLLQQRGMLSRDQSVVGFIGGKVYISGTGSSQ